jgi:hypothetical protein
MDDLDIAAPSETPELYASVPQNVSIENIADTLKVLENATIAETNATRALQDILVKLIHERET